MTANRAGRSELIDLIVVVILYELLIYYSSYAQ